MAIDVQEILGSQGPIARRLGGAYEVRPQQLEMSAAVQQALEAGQTLAVEAGTGVGKSFAYLVPAVKRVIEARKRVIISTHTISLQEQLIEKDIPMLRAVLGQEFSAVLVKGRNNYISRRRFELAFSRQDQLFQDDAEFRSLAAIQKWLGETQDGSLASMPTLERPDVWDRVRSDADNCMGRKCLRYKECFFQSARRRMENADLLIVNHALFFSDLVLRSQGTGFLPPYDLVILDEAHTIEDVVCEHFGVQITDTGLYFVLGHLFNTRTRKGILTSLRCKSGEGHGIVQKALEAVARAAAAVERFFDELVQWWQEQGHSSGRVRRPCPLENSLKEPLLSLVVLLRMLTERVKHEQDAFELNAYIVRLEAVAGSLDAWMSQTLEDHVYWIELGKGRRRRVRLASAPIDVAPILRQHLFHQLDREKKPMGVVLTSATLAAGRKQEGRDGFEILTSRLGCQEAQTLALDSPFDYESAVRLLVEADLPDPSDPRHTPSIIPRILHYIRQTQGGAFVLFTSYGVLNRVAEQVRGELTAEGYTLLVHGQDGPRGLLLKRFKTAQRGVLLGTDSFWAGVDVPGQALRNVIITRLPFAVPDRPLVEARVAAVIPSPNTNCPRRSSSSSRASAA